MAISVSTVLLLASVHSSFGLQAAIREALPTHFVYVKFHQVGSGTAFKTIDFFRNDSDVLRKLASEPIKYPEGKCTLGRFAISTPREDSFRISHEDSLPMLTFFAKTGVPRRTWAVTLMRSPGDKFLSWFYPSYFQSGATQSGAGIAYIGKFGNMTKNGVDDLWDTKSVEAAIIGDQYKPVQEYTHYLSNSTVAELVLSKFEIVGVTEDSDETFYRPLANLIGVSAEAMFEARLACEEHVHTLHPRMSDFSEEFNSYIRTVMVVDYDIYRVAVGLSGTQKTLLMG